LADPTQYLRLQLGKSSYLLPSTMAFTIEKREQLIVNTSDEGNVAAWQSVRSVRLPAYCLDGQLRVTRQSNWQRAIFLEASPHAIGLVVDEVQLLPRAETAIVPFTPPGLPPTRQGHLFSGASVMGHRIVLVLDPKAFVAYLQNLGDGT